MAIQSKLCESWIETFELFTLKTQTHNFNLTETSKFYKLIIYLWLQEECLKKIYPASLDQRDWTILLVISHTKKNQKSFFFENHDLISSENFWYNNDQSLIFPEDESSNLDLWSFLSKSLCFGQYFCHSMMWPWM